MERRTGLLPPPTIRLGPDGSMALRRRSWRPWKSTRQLLRRTIHKPWVIGPLPHRGPPPPSHLPYRVRMPWRLAIRLGSNESPLRGQTSGLVRAITQFLRDTIIGAYRQCFVWRQTVANERLREESTAALRDEMPCGRSINERAQGFAVAEP